MTKYFILNILLNFAIAFLVYGGIMAFQAGNQLYLFIAIALLVVMIYLKVVLLKVVKKDTSSRVGSKDGNRKK
ncbi:hypothetical protein BC792_1182 [Sphingobacterium allocomposti]|jgi:type VI protein secretion system component VasK|uniref:Sortase n=1 Tax=Sphingobacterium allocomposti TaxID=415956 RepID=A0A5S5D9K6_9SPHI|nr:DUF6358 family protein [Sphingobacterium composti Yoo et al. 2007 non Ten et al. 2007]TYP91756.1 hypothetical protein BC792_1182 [Sphingobacterium composti Yoo et al. 2007 non Ten et al. 2007]HLS93946.1 DUF6358 family protein [Sphingobacterium sp.]